MQAYALTQTLHFPIRKTRPDLHSRVVQSCKILLGSISGDTGMWNVIEMLSLQPHSQQSSTPRTTDPFGILGNSMMHTSAGEPYNGAFRMKRYSPSMFVC